MTEPKDPTVGMLDRDRAHRIMMQQGSKLLVDTLAFRHPKIVRHLRSLPNAQPLEDA